MCCSRQLRFLFFSTHAGLSRHFFLCIHVCSISLPLLYMLLWKQVLCLPVQSGCLSAPLCDNPGWITSSICFVSATGDNMNSVLYLSLYLLSLTLLLAVCPLSDTSFHPYSSSVTFSWSWQGAWGVWWAQLSLGCSYCCYTEAYSKNNTLLRPQPLDLNITPLQKSAMN